MSDNSEIYERKTHLDEFKKILKESAVYWKQPPNELFLDAMANKLLEYIGPYKDKLRAAIRICLDSQSGFPSVSDLQKAADVARKKPIDHIAHGAPDARAKMLSGCKQCRQSGYVRMMKGGYEFTATCDGCALGKYYKAVSGVPSKSEALNLGYQKFDYDKFYRGAQ